MKTNDLSLFNKNQSFHHVMNAIDRIEPGEHFMFDLSNDKHFEYWQLLFQSHNMTPKRYPKLHQHFTECRTKQKMIGLNELPAVSGNADSDGFVNNNAIAGLSLFENKCYAMAYSTIIGGTDTTTLILQILDADTHEVLGTDNITDVGNGRYVQMQTNGITEPRKIKAVLNYAIVKDDTPIVGAVKSDHCAGAADVPIVIQPASKPEHEDLKNIMIALSRGKPGEDCDYWFHEGEYDDNTIVVPFKGSAKFQSEIHELKHPDTFIINMSVVKAEGGEKVLKPHAMEEVYPWFSRVEDPKDPGAGKCVLQWNLPADGDGKTAGKPIQFEKSPWASDTVTLYQCTLCVKTKKSPDEYVYAFILSKQGEDSEANDSPGLKNIKPIVYFWHCLAMGTLISLTDGTTRPIESLEGGEMVRINKEGDALPVRATTLAHHTGKALTLKTHHGDQLTLSPCHVVMTPDGPKSAEELGSGDTVISINGDARIQSIEAIDFDDDLINLLLGEHERLKTIEDYETTMYANNIMVGDHQMQTKYLDYQRNHPKKILARIAHDWHTDFHSSLEDKKASRQ